MNSSASQSNYVYVILLDSKCQRVLMGLLVVCSTIINGETDDAFLIIGGLVEPNETLMACAIRHCRRLVDFCPMPSQRLYLAKVINGLVNHGPVKISIYVIYVLYKDRCWRARHHTPRMATLTVDHLNEIEASYEGQPGPLPPVEIPSSLTM
jgi:hypothetical protein